MKHQVGCRAKLLCLLKEGGIGTVSMLDEAVWTQSRHASRSSGDAGGRRWDGEEGSCVTSGLVKVGEVSRGDLLLGGWDGDGQNWVKTLVGDVRRVRRCVRRARAGGCCSIDVSLKPH